MKLASLALKLCLFAVAAAQIALPFASPTLSASPGSVAFQYNPPEAAPLPVFVAVTASNGAAPVLKVVVTPGANTPSTLFTQPVVTGDKIEVNYDPATFNELAGQPGTYTATYAVSSSGFTTLNIPVTLNIGGPLTIIPSSTSLSFYVPGPTAQVVSLAGVGGASVGFTVGWTTSGGGSWLNAAANQSTTPASLSVTVDSLNVPNGTYQGSVSVTPTTGTPTILIIPVTLQVGPNTLTANSNSFAFVYNVGGTVPPPQVLQLTSSITNDTYVAQAVSTGNWLLVNGLTSNVAGTLPANVNITVNPAGLSPGNYQGTITATDSENGTQTVTVTLAISALSNIANPISLTFVAQMNGPAPASQPVEVNGFGAATYTATANANWIAVSSTAGASPAEVFVSVNPAGMAAGTYTGSVTIDVNTHVQNIRVTLIVSADGVLTTDTGGFVFFYPGGAEPPPPFNINVGSSNSGSITFDYATGLPAWVQVSTVLATLSTPAQLAITLSPQILPTGTYEAQIILVPVSTTGGLPGIPIVVPIYLVVTNAPAANPSVTSLSFTAAASTGPQNQTVTVTASAPISFTTAASGGTWLSVEPSSGTADLGTTITVTADATNLPQGNYTGTVTLTTTGGVITQIAVSFTVTAANSQFSVSPSAMTFAYVLNGVAPPAQTLSVSGSQNFTAAVATDTGNWLAVTPASGTGNASLSVSVNPAGLSAGTYTGTITVTPQGGTAQIVTVTLTVSSLPSSLTATPSTLTFAYTAGSSLPSAQTVSIASTGGAIAFTATASSSGWLSVTPASGATPATLSVSVNPASLSGGAYSGSIALSANSGAVQLTINVTLNVSTSLPNIDRVVNAASYLDGGIAPGELVTIFGSSLGPFTGVGATIQNGFIGTSLANVQVTFNGYPAPILYAGAGQINAIVPYEIASYSSVSVEALFGTARSNPVTLPVESSATGLFTANASGSGPGAILDLNYHLVSTSNPVSAGSYIQVFATGQGQTQPAGVDGLIEPVTLPLPAPILNSTATIGGLPANIVYVGAAPGLVAGALQVDLQVPAGLPSGPAEVIVIVGGINSQTGVTVAIQ